MKRGDVVLVFVPFVGTPGGKHRPAIVVQNDMLNGLLRETMIVEVTSNLSHTSRPHQVPIDVKTPDGTASGLLVNSAIRCERLHTVPQSSVIKLIGTLSMPLMQLVDEALKCALGIK